MSTLNKSKQFPTVLDKWRRKGFELATILDDKIEKNKKKLEILKSQNLMRIKEIKQKENEIAEEKRNITNLTSQLKLIESENMVNERHISDFNSSDKKSEEIFNNIIECGSRHRKLIQEKSEDFFKKNEFEIDKITLQIKKMRSFKIPPSVLKVKSEEQKTKKLKAILSSKQKDIEEHEAAESIYSKMIESYKKLNQLKLQFQAVEESKEQERIERQKEDELKRQYEELQENGRVMIQNEEQKLKKRFDNLMLERNNINLQIDSLQRQIEKYSTIVHQTNESTKEKNNNYIQRIHEQETEIEKLEKQIVQMESQMRFDCETNTDPEKPKMPSMCQPSFPSFSIQQEKTHYQHNRPPTEQNIDNELLNLLQRAKMVYNGSIPRDK